MEYAVDLNDYPDEVIDRFMKELESKSSICWVSKHKPTQFKMSKGFRVLGAGYNGLSQGTQVCEKKLLTRSQFIEKMAELYPLKKQDIRKYCKEHRVWAAKDGDGKWWGWPKKPETINNPLSNTWNSSRCGVQSLPNNLNYPDVPWDKSLIAPDGSMPLWDETRKAQKRATCSWNPADWIEVDPPKEEKKSTTPHRGDPVFVWDDNASDRIPATVRYFSRIDETSKYPIRVLSETIENEEDYRGYTNYRIYDASLVEVPRRKWPKQ